MEIPEGPVSFYQPEVYNLVVRWTDPPPTAYWEKLTLECDVLYKEGGPCDTQVFTALQTTGDTSTHNLKTIRSRKATLSMKHHHYYFCVWPYSISQWVKSLRSFP